MIIYHLEMSRNVIFEHLPCYSQHKLPAWARCCFVVHVQHAFVCVNECVKVGFKS